MRIIPYTKLHRPQLEDSMVAYMAERNSDIPEHIIRTKLFDTIHSQLDTGVIRIDLAFDGSSLAGFSVYQLDTQESDWCKRPGWGFIREFYVIPEFRKHGTGRMLAQSTEQALREMGAGRLYLTTTTAAPFWRRCGWMLTGTRCSNGQLILEK